MNLYSVWGWYLAAPDETRARALWWENDPLDHAFDVTDPLPVTLLIADVDVPEEFYRSVDDPGWIVAHNADNFSDDKVRWEAIGREATYESYKLADFLPFHPNQKAYKYGVRSEAAMTGSKARNERIFNRYQKERRWK